MVGVRTNPAYILIVFSGPENIDSSTICHGKLLLADPSLRNSQFYKSVVLINHHTPEDGAMGLILNHPTGRVVGDLLSDPVFAPLTKLAVHDGGPVEQEQLTFSSFWWDENKQLQWAIRISAEDATDHVKRPGHIVRAFIGYSGWVEGQLEDELNGSFWFPINPSDDLLGQAHDKALWTKLMSDISPIHRILAEAPENPELN